MFMMRTQRVTVALFIIVLLGLLLRLAQMYMSPLWYDEICSLCFATGHCMGVPIDQPIRTDLGDYKSPDSFVPASYFKKYAQFPHRLPDLKTVLRAADIGDEHPPLHIVTLAIWLAIFGA